MKNEWIYLAFLTLILTSISVICIKHFSMQISKNEDKISVCFYYLIVSFIGLIYLLYNKNDSLKFINKYKYNYKFIGFILFLSLLTLFTKKIALNTFTTTPNIGYSHLIINLNVILTTIAAYFLYNQKIKLKSFIGMVIALIGASLIITD